MKDKREEQGERSAMRASDRRGRMSQGDAQRGKRDEMKHRFHREKRLRGASSVKAGGSQRSRTGEPMAEKTDLRRTCFRFDPDEPRRTLNASPQLAPVPAVLVSMGWPDGRANLMTVAWVGIVNSDPPMLSISIRKERYSYEILDQSCEFVVNCVGRSLLHALDYCGVQSGRDVNKWQACHLHAETVPECPTAPAVAEAPLYLACQVKERKDLGSHILFLAEIVAVRVKESLFDSKGQFYLDAADLIVYQHGQYHALGEWLGFFGCALAPPERYRQRMKDHQNGLQEVEKKRQAAIKPKSDQPSEPGKRSATESNER